MNNRWSLRQTTMQRFTETHRARKDWGDSIVVGRLTTTRFHWHDAPHFTNLITPVGSNHQSSQCFNLNCAVIVQESCTGNKHMEIEAHVTRMLWKTTNMYKMHVFTGKCNSQHPLSKAVARIRRWNNWLIWSRRPADNLIFFFFFCCFNKKRVFLATLINIFLFLNPVCL